MRCLISGPYISRHSSETSPKNEGRGVGQAPTWEGTMTRKPKQRVVRDGLARLRYELKLLALDPREGLECLELELARLRRALGVRRRRWAPDGTVLAR